MQNDVDKKIAQLRHDLKNYINLIYGNAQILEFEDTEEGRDKSLADIQESCLTLTQEIDRILTYQNLTSMINGTVN